MLAVKLAEKLADIPPADTLTEIPLPDTVLVVIEPVFFSPYAYLPARFLFSAFRQTESAFCVIRVPSTFLNRSGSFVPPDAPEMVTVQLAPSSSDSHSVQNTSGQTAFWK
jgi:hypothetical protein